MIGEKLKELREANGLVKRQVAAQSNVDKTYISKMENNKKPVSRNHLTKLRNFFKVPEDELLTILLTDKLYVTSRRDGNYQ